jgi:hypothetical protein
MSCKQEFKMKNYECKQGETAVNINIKSVHFRFLIRLLKSQIFV